MAKFEVPEGRLNPEKPAMRFTLHKNPQEIDCSEAPITLPGHEIPSWPDLSEYETGLLFLDLRGNDRWPDRLENELPQWVGPQTKPHVVVVTDSQGGSSEESKERVERLRQRGLMLIDERFRSGRLLVARLAMCPEAVEICAAISSCKEEVVKILEEVRAAPASPDSQSGSLELIKRRRRATYRVVSVLADKYGNHYRDPRFFREVNHQVMDMLEGPTPFPPEDETEELLYVMDETEGGQVAESIDGLHLTPEQKEKAGRIVASYDELLVRFRKTAEDQVHPVLEQGVQRSGIETSTGTSFPVESSKDLTPEQREQLLKTLEARFKANDRHKGLEWQQVKAKLDANPEKLRSLNEMERTGGEPDVVRYIKGTNEFVFYDCSKESPKGRRNCVYDREAQERLEREDPQEVVNSNAVDNMAKAMGITILNPDQYRELLKLGIIDRYSYSWLDTPAEIRETGCALVGGRGFGGEVLVYLRDARDHSDVDWAFRGALSV